MNGIDALAEIVQQRTGADAPVLEKLAHHVADAIGAWIAASKTSEGKALIAFRKHSQIADRSAAPSLDIDIATHVALVRLSEIDDIHLQSMTTPGAIAVPAALTLAAALPQAEIGDVIAAMLAGYEAVIRLGLAIKGPDVLYRGIWPTYFGAGFATAAVAARLLRLDLKQTAHALALSLSFASPSVGQHHAATTARWFSVGNAARNGLTAARAAQAGFTADVEILRSHLFAEVYGIEPDVAALAEPNLPVFEGVSLKPWCAARQTMAATQALREVLATGITADDIWDVTAHVPPPHLKMIDHGVKLGDRASFLTSLPYQLALAALQPAQMATLDPAAPTPLPLLESFMMKIKVAGDEKLLRHYPAVWPARIVVTTRSGEHSREVQNVPGDPARPLSAADIRRKFVHFVAPVCGQATDRIWHSALTAPCSREALLRLMEELRGVMVQAGD